MRQFSHLAQLGNSWLVSHRKPLRNRTNRKFMNQTAFEVHMNPQFELAAELLIELIRLRMIHEPRARSL